MSDEWEPGASTLDRRRITVVSRGVESLLESLPVITGRARRRQVLKTKGVRILRLYFDAGQVLCERAENAPMLIPTLQGRVTLTVEGEQHVDVDDRLIPVGTSAVDGTRWDLRAGRPVADLDLDDCWVVRPGPDGSTHTLRAGDGRSVSLWADPRFAYGYYNAGLTYDRINRPDLAIARLEMFVRLAPGAPERPEVTSILQTVRGR